LVEDLNPVVLPIADEQPTARIERKRVDAVELAGACALLAPRLENLPFLSNFITRAFALGALP
jgi:hypothetical protein